jgi:hypothetical protein
VVRDAALTSAVAAAVDYTITPHRFTPGWELVLSKRSMAVGYAGMAAGFVASEYLLPVRQRAEGSTARRQHAPARRYPPTRDAPVGDVRGMDFMPYALKIGQRSGNSGC